MENVPPKGTAGSRIPLPSSKIPLASYGAGSRRFVLDDLTVSNVGSSGIAKPGALSRSTGAGGLQRPTKMTSAKGKSLAILSAESRARDMRSNSTSTSRSTSVSRSSTHGPTESQSESSNEPIISDLEDRLAVVERQQVQVMELKNINNDLELARTKLADELSRREQELSTTRRELDETYRTLNNERKQRATEYTQLTENQRGEIENLEQAYNQKLNDIRSNADLELASCQLELKNTEQKLKQLEEITAKAQKERNNMEMSMKTLIFDKDQAVKAVETDSAQRISLMEMSHEQNLHRVELNFKKEMEMVNSRHTEELDRINAHNSEDLSNQMQSLTKRFNDQTNLLEEQVQKSNILIANLKKDFQSQMEEQIAKHHHELEQQMSQKEVDIESLQGQLRDNQFKLQAQEEEYEKLKNENNKFQSSLLAFETASSSHTTVAQSLNARIQQLEYQLQFQAKADTDLQAQLAQTVIERDSAMEKLLKEETIRRKLHNQVQELKGNIRVFCRVKPAGNHECADISFPDKEIEGQEILVKSPTIGGLGITGASSTVKLQNFNFDKVFDPQSTNNDVFEEISQLVQSALDGYNVCIFAYGQTGSGKTFTMSSEDGMIPRAVSKIFNGVKTLEEKGWKYELRGEFLEIYNETINDLLGTPDDIDKAKLEIRHDTKQKRTIITDLTSVILESPQGLADVLRRASRNRSVAATKANERSSRSHCLFILRLKGSNYVTGETCDGTLNLIDLAGSERLSQSQATGDRLKETQSINRSLSCLTDVICALGREGGHVPYRNSKVRLHESEMC